jgi:5-methylcytosine-specific restriction protein A
MSVDFSQIEEGQVYSRPALARLWKFKGYQGFGKGVFTPARSKYIVLFVTKLKQKEATQYVDFFRGDVLHWEGEERGRSDDRIIRAKERGDEIKLFYRERHHRDFTYFGAVTLLEHAMQTGRATKFQLGTNRTAVSTESALEAEIAAHGGVDEGPQEPQEEGKKGRKQHFSYERSKTNRKNAIKIHGHICGICKFDFDQFYGLDLALSFIEVHHIKSLARNPGIVDPKTDLMPVCSNCHSMLHKRRPDPYEPKDIRASIESVRVTFGAGRAVTKR